MTGPATSCPGSGGDDSHKKNLSSSNNYNDSDPNSCDTLNCSTKPELNSSSNGMLTKLGSVIRRLLDVDGKESFGRDGPVVLPVGPNLTAILDASLYASSFAPLLASTVSASTVLLSQLFDALDMSVGLADVAWHALLLCPPNRDTRAIHRRTIVYATDVSVTLTGIIRRLTSDRLAASANVPSSYPGGGASSASSSSREVPPSPASSSASGAGGGGHRAPHPGESTWESPRLFLPEYVWAEEAAHSATRALRTLAARHPPLPEPTTIAEVTHPYRLDVEELRRMTEEDLSAAIRSLRRAAERDGAAGKRAYLVKTSVRGPLRAFLESHATLRRAPPPQDVERALARLSAPASVAALAAEEARTRLKELLCDERLERALEAEECAERMHADMGRMVWPFVEMARAVVLMGRLRIAAGKEGEAVREIVRRLCSLVDLYPPTSDSSSIPPMPPASSPSNSGDNRGGFSSTPLPPYAGSEHAAASFEIHPSEDGAMGCHRVGARSFDVRPLLMDLQGIPRKILGGDIHVDDGYDPKDEFNDTKKHKKRYCRFKPSDLSVYPFGSFPDHLSPEKANELRCYRLAHLLRRLSEMVYPVLRKAAVSPSSHPAMAAAAAGTDAVQLPLSDGVVPFDPDLFAAQYADWYHAVSSQHRICSPTKSTFRNLPDRIRQAEMELGFLSASRSALEGLRGRIASLRAERTRRFLVLSETVTEVWRREVGREVVLEEPGEDEVLDLKRSKAKGLFGKMVEERGMRLPHG